MKGYKMSNLGIGILASLAILVSASFAQDCQSDLPLIYYLLNGDNAAPPKAGWRIWDNDSPGSYVTASDLKFVFCDVGPAPENCPHTGSDTSFSSSQTTSVRTAIANWSDARNTNNSGLQFTEVYSLGIEPMAIEIKKRNVSAMPGALGLTQYNNVRSVDTNNDGVTDFYRVSNFQVELRSDISSADWTRVAAHELGHVMGLDNCMDCEVTSSVMAPLNSSRPSAPTVCDNNRIATYMQNP